MAGLKSMNLEDAYAERERGWDKYPVLADEAADGEAYHLYMGNINATLREVAEVVGKPVSTVRARIWRYGIYHRMPLTKDEFMTIEGREMYENARRRQAKEKGQ